MMDDVASTQTLHPWSLLADLTPRFPLARNKFPSTRSGQWEVDIFVCVERDLMNITHLTLNDT
jgi:hypothetical protein